MEGSDVLQTLAEVAIALTGFTGIVVALRGRVPGASSGFAGVRFRILLVASLVALGLALAPFLFHHLGATSAATWSIGSGIVAAIWVPIVVHDVRAAREFADSMPTFDRRVMPFLALAGSALWILQLANAFFLHAFGPYLAAPLWFVAFSAFQFTRLLLDPPA